MYIHVYITVIPYKSINSITHTNVHVLIQVKYWGIIPLLLTAVNTFYGAHTVHDVVPVIPSPLTVDIMCTYTHPHKLYDTHNYTEAIVTYMYMYIHV